MHEYCMGLFSSYDIHVCVRDACMVNALNIYMPYSPSAYVSTIISSVHGFGQPLEDFLGYDAKFTFHCDNKDWLCLHSI